MELVSGRDEAKYLISFKTVFFCKIVFKINLLSKIPPKYYHFIPQCHSNASPTNATTLSKKKKLMLPFKKKKKKLSHRRTQTQMPLYMCVKIYNQTIMKHLGRKFCFPL
jgi:hypothetical protein